MSTLKGFEPPNTLTQPNTPSTSLAFRRVDLMSVADRQFLDSIVTVGSFRARESWGYYETLGEVHYGISRSARVAGYGRFIPERINAVGAVTNSAEEGVLADIVSGITSPFGGTRGLLERFYTLMKIPAEAFLIRVRDGAEGKGDPDGYWLLSPEEIDSESFTGTGEIDRTKPIKWITANVAGGHNGTTVFHRMVQPEDFLGRIWNPSKRWVDMVDSPMIPLNGLCEMLVTINDSMMGRLKQRFALAGILLIPSEINDANIAGAKPGEEHSDKVLNYLITLMTRNVMNHREALGHIPALLKGPAAALEAVRHLIPEGDIAEQDLRMRAELIDGILDGLDVQKAKAKGGEGENHWASWSSSEDEIRLAVRPDLEALADALTRAVLRVELRARGWADGKIRPWRVGIDLTDASVRTNQAEDFRQGWDRGWLSDKAGRRSIGAKESDAPSSDELVRITGRILQDPYLALYGIDGKDGITIDFDKVKTTKPTGPAAGPGAQGKAGPGVGSPGSPSSRDSDAPRSKTPG